MTIKLDRLDHLVLTVRDIEATCRFYERVLGTRTSRPAASRSRWARSNAPAPKGRCGPSTAATRTGT